MTTDDLLGAVRAQPFRPFRLQLTTGVTYEIRHPELLMVGRRTAVIGLTADPGDAIYDRTVMVDLLHIFSLEHHAAVTPGSNGQSAG